MRKNKDFSKFVVHPLVIAITLSLCYSSSSIAASINGKVKFEVGGGNTEYKTNRKVVANYNDLEDVTSKSPDTNQSSLSRAIQLDYNTIKFLSYIAQYGDKAGFNESQTEFFKKISELDNVGTSDNEASFKVVKDENISFSIGDESKATILGVVGGDLSLNTGLEGNITTTGSLSNIEDLSFADLASNSITRNGNINMNVVNGDVIGGIGASTAISIGNIDIEDSNGELTFNLTTNGFASTTVNGDVNVNNGSNVQAFTTGSGALAIGGEARSIVNGNTNLIINSKVDTDNIEGLTIGASGGGLAVSTLGGRAISNIKGSTNVSINNGLALGLSGGSVVASIDASKIGSLIAGHEIGNNDGTSDLNFKADLDLNTEGTITFKEVYNGGEAIGSSKDSTINLSGSTSAFGVIGGGVAGSLHTYNVRAEGGEVPDGMNIGDALGTSSAESTTGKTTINVNISKADGTKITSDEKAELIVSIKNLINGDTSSDSLEKITNALADKGVVMAITGGGLSIAYTDKTTGSFNQNFALSQAVTRNDGTELNLNSGYVLGAFGGGIAISEYEGTSLSRSTDNIIINVNGSEVEGLFANGVAVHRNANQAGNAAVEASDTEVNVNSGSVAGVFGGGIAVRSETSLNTESSRVSTTGTSTLNIASNINKLSDEGISNIFSFIDDGSFQEHFEETQELVKNAAVVGGGIAAGKGIAHVEKVVINIKDGADIQGDVVAGGVALKDGMSTVNTATVNWQGGKVSGALIGQGLGQGTVTHSALNVIGNVTLNALTTDSKINGFHSVTFAQGTEIILDGLEANNKLALIDGEYATGTDGSIITTGSRLNISKLEAGTDNKYFIATNYYKDDSSLWGNSDLLFDRTSYVASTEEVGGNYNIIYKTLNDASYEEKEQAVDDFVEILSDIGGQTQGIIEGIVKNGGSTTAGAKEFFADASSSLTFTRADLVRGLLLGEISGVTSNTINMANNMAESAFLRLSFTQDSIQGAALDTNGALWIKYLHNKYDIDGMSSSLGGLSSSNTYDGITIGLDLAKFNNAQTGIALSYVDGDGDGYGVNNEYDMWGATIYGNINNELYNLIGDIGYSVGDNDISGYSHAKHLTTNRDLSVLSIGTRLERLFKIDNSQIVPYVGLRYMNVDADNYTTYYDGKEAFENQVDSQNIWTVPFGVSLRNETITDNGWTITPNINLAYIWAFGDTDNDVTVNAGSGSSVFSYDVIDSGSYLGSVSLEAGYNNFRFGAGYSYQKGREAESNKFFVNFNYSF